MQTLPHEVEISAETEDALELLRQAKGLPSTTAVLELLIGRQLDTTVFQMTGIRPGPRLAIDNTRGKA